jgi:hypothetical protein
MVDCFSLEIVFGCLTARYYKSFSNVLRDLFELQSRTTIGREIWTIQEQVTHAMNGVAKVWKA